jgi:Skp family chaperone for outer membrane proteins
MKHIMLTAVVPLLLVATTARAEDRVGYVDMTRVLSESNPAKQNQAAINDWAAPHFAAIDKAPAAKKAEMQQNLQKDADQRFAPMTKALRERAKKIIAKLATEQKLRDVIAGEALYTKHDLTDEVIKRLNAEPYQPPALAADDYARAQAKIAALTAENESLKTKAGSPPAPPAPPQPKQAAPPAAPLASKKP